MSRVRTTPEVQLPITNDYVMDFGVEMAYNEDGTSLKVTFIGNQT